MSSYTFRKYDAPSVLVVDKTWRDILNKPADFDELAARILAMANEAQIQGLLTKFTTLSQFKDAVNTVLLNPLQEEVVVPPSSDDDESMDGETILADAFWDEIVGEGEVWEKLYEAMQRANAVRVQIEEHSALSAEDTLMDTKTNFNEVILKPLNGIEKDD